MQRAWGSGNVVERRDKEEDWAKIKTAELAVMTT